MFNVRAQMGQLMETIQDVARGQKAIAKGQKELCQATLRDATAGNPPTLIPAGLAMQIPMGPPVGIPPSMGGGLVNQSIMHTVNPPVLEVDDHNDAFFNPRDESVYDAFGPTSDDIERKFCAIEEKMKAMKGSNAFGIDTTEMCLVSCVQIPAKFKVHEFENYEGVRCPRTHVRAYCRKMAAYSSDEKLLMHFFQENLSRASLEWYMQLKSTSIRTWKELVETFLKHY